MLCVWDRVKREGGGECARTQASLKKKTSNARLVSLHSPPSLARKREKKKLYAPPDGCAIHSGASNAAAGPAVRPQSACACDHRRVVPRARAHTHGQARAFCAAATEWRWLPRTRSPQCLDRRGVTSANAKTLNPKPRTPNRADPRPRPRTRIPPRGRVQTFRAFGGVLTPPAGTA